MGNVTIRMDKNCAKLEQKENECLKTICEYRCMTLKDYVDARTNCLHPAIEKCENCHRRICEGQCLDENEIYRADENERRIKELELYSRIGQKLNEEEEEFLKEMWNKRVEEMREETKRELRKLKK